MNEKIQDFLSWHIYQIYPRSFCDSNGDGIGDLAGVLSKLDYLKSLGVNAIWLCPCYKSPNVDNGYDVSDYRDIMPEFGTLEDMRNLIEAMHKRNMKLIMDLVPNHTSDQHVWFQESRKSRSNPYSDYYYWFDSVPNDWQSCFGGSAYTFDAVRGQYYLHSYAPQQPDLNWDNPEVVKQMQSVVDFWVDMGVDGFRIDVIDQISKDFPGNQNCFGPHLHEYIRALFGREKTKHLFTVGECWAQDIEEVRRHCAADRQELSTLFQFDHLEVGREGKFQRKPDSLRSLWKILSGWQTTMQQEELLYSLFTDNHDNGWLLDRIGSKENRYGSATCLAAMVYLLRGVSFLYQGQEFGMCNSSHDTIEAFDDVESINLYPVLCESIPPEEALARINFGSRDNTRHPMCWSDAHGAGFTEGMPWMALHADYKAWNLKQDLSGEQSVFRFYQALLSLKAEHPALTLGTFEDLTPDCASFCLFRRKYKNESVLVACNFEAENEIVLPVTAEAFLFGNFRTDSAKDYFHLPYEITVWTEKN